VLADGHGHYPRADPVGEHLRRVVTGLAGGAGMP